VSFRQRWISCTSGKQSKTFSKEKCNPSKIMNFILIEDTTINFEKATLMPLAQFQELLSYPQCRWAEAASERWRSLCNGLRDYNAPSRAFVIDTERKWELVSAVQKSIRRGDKQMALRLISAMDSMPKEYGYFWRRLCVIACEDVGPADDVLASFVVGCATVFPPKKTGRQNYDLICFLAEQMCDLSNRSRIYCSYAAIEPAAIKAELPELSSQDKSIITAIMQRRAAVEAPENPWRAWQKKNDWRAEGMLKFIGLTLPMELNRVHAPIPAYKMLFDLPSCCYDVHTRVGLRVLQRLVQGVQGAEGINEFFKKNRITGKHRALGEVLFSVEGGRIEGELVYEPLSSLEQRLFAHQFGLTLNGWCDLRVLVQKALEKGVVDRVREEVLQQFYGQGQLQLIAPGGGPINNTTN